MIICCKDHICCLFCVFHFIIIEDQYVILWKEEIVHTCRYMCVYKYFTTVLVCFFSFVKLKWEIVFVKTGYLINETNMWLLFLLRCAYSQFTCPRG